MWCTLALKVQHFSKRNSGRSSIFVDTLLTRHFLYDLQNWVCCHKWRRDHTPCRHRVVKLDWCFIWVMVKSKVKTGYLYSGTVSLTATGGCRLFCSALPVRSAWLLLIRHPQKLVTGWVGPGRRAHAMPWLLARHSTAPTREYYAVIQRAQCWWATTCGCRDEESKYRTPAPRVPKRRLYH